VTEEAYDRARIELALLRMELATGSHREHTDPQQRALRIRQLQELIARHTRERGPLPADSRTAPKPAHSLNSRWHGLPTSDGDVAPLCWCTHVTDSRRPAVPPGLLGTGIRGCLLTRREQERISPRFSRIAIGPSRSRPHVLRRTDRRPSPCRVSARRPRGSWPTPAPASATPAAHGGGQARIPPPWSGGTRQLGSWVRKAPPATRAVCEGDPWLVRKLWGAMSCEGCDEL
jgi:hypothetical protein